MTRIGEKAVSRRSLLLGSAAGLAAAALSQSPAVAAPRAGGRWLRPTGHRGGIRMDSRGNLTDLQIGDTPCTLRSDQPSGLIVVDATRPDQPRQVGGVVTDPVARHGRPSGEIKQDATLTDLGLQVSASYRPVGASAIEVTGVVIDRTGRDRVVDVLFAVPVDPAGWRWETNLVDAITVGTSAPPNEVLFPLAALSHPDKEIGLALAIPPESPALFELGTDPAAPWFFLRQQFGISHQAVGDLRGRAPFRFVIDLLDGGWGFRQGLANYYARSQQTFTSHTDRNGLWQLAPASWYPEDLRQFYAFHETGIAAEGDVTMDQYAQSGEFASDQARGIYTIPYTVVGQASLNYLDTLPTTYDEAVALLSTWNHPPNVYGGPQPRMPISFRSAEEFKDVIEGSALYDAAGKYRWKPRNTKWGHKSATFILNPSPGLHRIDGHKTIAGYMLDTLVPDLLSASEVDGVFVDVLHTWGHYYDYRAAHFPSASIPLSYEPDTLRPCVFNSFAQQEYLWALRDMLHSKGKVLHGNARQFTRQGGTDYRAVTFNQFALDVLGTEMGIGDAPEPRLAMIRATGAQKPCLALSYGNWRHENIVAAWWNKALLYGIYSCSGPRAESGFDVYDIEREYMQRYVPVLRTLSEAGWEPVTGVRPSSDAVHIERYGNGSDYYIVVHNTAGVRTTFTLDVDRSVVRPIPGHHRSAADQRRSEGRRFSRPQVTLNPDETKVLQVGSVDLSAQAPDLFDAVAPTTVTTVLNSFGGGARRDIDLTLSAPDGWTVVPTSTSHFPVLRPGSAVKTTWAVTPPADTPTAPTTLVAHAAFAHGHTTSTLSQEFEVNVPVPLARAFDNAGISDDADLDAADYDGRGNSFSAQALAGAGLTPGAHVRHAGVDFTWPDTAPGQPDNALAQRQTIALSGSGASLGFLGAGSFATNPGGRAVVHYTDGTVDGVEVNIHDWQTAPSGTDPVATLPYYNAQGFPGKPRGQTKNKVYVFCVTVPIDAAKSVAAVTLPDATTLLADKTEALHIFAAAVG